ncbi:prostaglandin E2 receptor EP4 subtype-like [Saccostrea cucullata]|uniref:prostaglandin E2 receptor EP4 subtype-like n=1 Tax=Saccostrea cuccullata TaxID=36930 RepID=UPI002ED60A47
MNLSNWTHLELGEHHHNESRIRMASMVVPSVMFTAGVLGNSLALLVLYSSRKEQKQSVFYRLVGALAVTDLFGTCATSPVILLVYANGLKWQGGQPLCNYASFMMIFAGLSTMFILAAMAFDRYLALNRPYFYTSHVNPTRVKYIFPILLTAALVMACLPLIGVGDNVHHFPGTWCFFDYYGTTVRVKSFAILYSLLGLTVLTMIIILNFVVLKTVWSLHRKACEIQMVVFLVGILTVICVCWAPLMIRVFLIQTGFKEEDVIQDLIFIRMASFNQILDPWVYILFRKTLFTRLVQFIKVHLCLPKKQFDSKRPGIQDSEEIKRLKQTEAEQYHREANGPLCNESTGTVPSCEDY